MGIKCVQKRIYASLEYIEMVKWLNGLICRLSCIFGRRRRKRKSVHKDLPNGNIAKTLTDSKTETDEHEKQKLGLHSEKSELNELR